MPVDLFDKYNVSTKSAPVDLLSNVPDRATPQSGTRLTPEMIHSLAESGQPIESEMSGIGENIAQSLSNAPIGVYDLLRKPINYLLNQDTLPFVKPLKFAPKKGNIIGPLLSLMIGGEVMAPTKAINALSKLSGASRLGSAAIKGATGVGSGALLGAVYDPEHPGRGAEYGAAGGALGGVGGAASRAASKVFKSPIGRTAARAAIGGIPGYLIGGPEGALVGMGAGALTPSVLNELSIRYPGSLSPGRESLRRMGPEALERQLSARSLGSPITPGEASLLPSVGAREAAYSKTPEAEELLESIKSKRDVSQEKSINKLLDTIYDKKPETDKKLSALYKNSLKNYNLHPNVLNSITKNENISRAIEKIENSNSAEDTAIRESIKGVPRNNLLFLDAVKRKLDDSISTLSRGATPKPNAAHSLIKTKNKLVDFMDNISPSYSKAREMAQQRIIRRKIEGKLKGERRTGVEFYRKILDDNNKYNDLLKSLQHVPEAQNQMRDMKLAWKNLISSRTARQGYGKSENSMNKARSSMEYFTRLVAKSSGEKANKEALRFIYSGKWDDEIKNIDNIKTRSGKSKAFSSLIDSIIRSATIASSNSNIIGDKK